MLQSNVAVLPYGSFGRMNSQQYGASYNFFLAPLEVLGSTNLKQMKFNRKKIRLVAMVLFVTALIFGIYAAYGGSAVLNEVGMAVSYFEPVPVVHSGLNAGRSAFIYYYFTPWSGSYNNALQSMINALYASGLGYVINLFGNFLGQEFGIYFTTAQVVVFVAETLYSMYDGATVVNATLLGAEAAGVDLGMTTIDIIVDGFVLPVLYPLVGVVAVA